MTRKKKRRRSVVEFGNGPTKVRIYTMNRKDGYPEFTLAWKEGGRRRVRSLSDMEEARKIIRDRNNQNILSVVSLLLEFRLGTRWPEG